MADQWAHTDEHSPDPNSAWASTEEHSPTTPKTVGGFASNVISSGVNLVKNMATAVAHPLDTLSAIGSVPVGVAEKVVGHPIGTPSVDEQGNQKPTSAQMLDAMLGHFKDRYGSLEKARDALYQDPVGVLSDVSMLAGGAGMALKGAGVVADAAGASRLAATAGVLARGARTAAEIADPVNAVGRLASGGVRMTGLPERMYQSALKPGARVGKEAAVREVIQTGLREGIPVSKGGVDKLHSLIEDLGQKIQDRIDAGAGAGVTVDPYRVAARTGDTEAQFASQVNPEADLNAIRSSRQEFLRSQGERPGAPAGPPQSTGLLDASGNPIMGPGTPAVPPTPAAPIPADVAQRLKQGTYQQIKKSYGQLSGAAVESMKALARGIKEELAAQIPEIGSLNARDSRLLAIQNALENRVRVLTNHNMVGIGTPIFGGAAMEATGSGKIGLVAGLLKAALEDPAIKSKIAIAINGARSASPTKWGAPNMGTALAKVREYAEAMNAASAAPAMANTDDQQPAALPEPPQVAAAAPKQGVFLATPDGQVHVFENDAQAQRFQELVQQAGGSVAAAQQQ